MKGEKEMEFQTLKKNYLKRNILIGAVIVAIISACILSFTRAKYRITQNIKIAEGTINYSLADLNIVAIYVDNVEVETLPVGNYELTNKSYCTVNNERDDSINLSYDNNTQTLNISPMENKGTKCYLYFDELSCAEEACNTILANKTIASRTDFSTTLSGDTTGIIYYENTSKGRTYYFAGNPSDNWVNFAGFYWRIIRINEDESIRMIYAGTDPNITTGTGIQLSNTSSFNSSYNDNMYVGLKYTSGQVHGTGTDSTILTALNEWYSTNLNDYGDAIDENVGFCGDRTPSTSPSSSNGSGGTGTISTYYGGYIRLYVNKMPTFECSDEDLFTTSGSGEGNASLLYPIGLISMDAGGYSSNNMDYYLYTGENYWSMTPFYFDSSLVYPARTFFVDSNGSLGDGWVAFSFGVRPVINLRADINLTGDGTAISPYEIAS